MKEENEYTIEETESSLMKYNQEFHELHNRLKNYNNEQQLDNMQIENVKLERSNLIAKRMDNKLCEMHNYYKMVQEIKDKGFISETSQKDILVKANYQKLLPYLADVYLLKGKLENELIPQLKKEFIELFMIENTDEDVKKIEQTINKVLEDCLNNEYTICKD